MSSKKKASKQTVSTMECYGSHYFKPSTFRDCFAEHFGGSHGKVSGLANLRIRGVKSPQNKIMIILTTI